MSSQKDEENIIICISFLQHSFHHFYFWEELFCRSFWVPNNYSHFGICSWRSHRSLFGNGILLPKLSLPTVRKKCSSDQIKLSKVEAEGQEFAKILRSLEQFLITVGKDNFGNKILFFSKNNVPQIVFWHIFWRWSLRFLSQFYYAAINFFTNVFFSKFSKF